MRFHPQNGPEILASQSGIPAKNPKSEILPKSEIWPLSIYYSVLRVALRISDASFRNPGAILNNDFIFNNLFRIPRFRKSPPKGVGDLPAVGGGGHHLPLGHHLGPEFWSENNPTTAAGTAKHQPPSSSTPSSQPEKETTHG
jgi:hypothetical protein